MRLGLLSDVAVEEAEGGVVAALGVEEVEDGAAVVVEEVRRRLLFRRPRSITTATPTTRYSRPIADIGSCPRTVYNH